MIAPVRVTIIVGKPVKATAENVMTVVRKTAARITDNRTIFTVIELKMATPGFGIVAIASIFSKIAHVEHRDPVWAIDFGCTRRPAKIVSSI